MEELRRKRFDHVSVTRFPIVAWDIETTGLNWKKDTMFGFSMAGYDPVGGVMMSQYWDIRETPQAMSMLQYVMDNSLRIVNHNIKFDALFAMEAGIKVPLNKLQCTSVRAALINEWEESFSLDSLSFKYLGERKVDIYRELADMFGGKPTRNAQMPNLHKAPPDMVGKYAKVDSELAAKLWHWQQNEIDRQGLHTITELELEVMPVIIDMERHGVRVDMDRAEHNLYSINKQVMGLQANLCNTVGREVNYGSPKQMRELFEVFKTTDDMGGVSWHGGGVVLELTDSGIPSIDANALRRMAIVGDPLAQSILELRKLTKCASFLKDHILGHSIGGRVYPNYNQCRSENGLGTGTGRFCIAQGQRVSTPRGEIPIEQIKVGEWVYCYGDDKDLKLKKVDGVYYSGYKECVKLKWVSSSRTRADNSGTLTCTPEHKIRLKTGEYIKASDVVDGTEVLHARRRAYMAGKQGNKKSGVRVYSTDRRCQDEHSIIIRDVFGAAYADSKKCRIHHKGRLIEACDCAGKNKLDVANKLRAGHAIIDRLFASHELERNHQLYSAIPAGKHHVWDLGVEGEHNFIVEEICVHNSISGPALQQIPAKDKEICEITRSCFIPDEHCEWLKLDYSQFEVRVFAHYVNDASLNQKYQEDPDTDLHQAVADLTGLPRNATGESGGANAKQINLGLIFGEGEGTMASEMKLPYSVGPNGRKIAGPEAAAIFRQYHSSVPGIKQLLGRASNLARTRGYVKTAMGRHLRFPGGKFTHKAGGLVFQGTAADAMKLKMVEIHKLSKEYGYSMLLSVHDELNFSMPVGMEHTKMIVDAYTDFHGPTALMKFRIPITCEYGYGPNWHQAGFKSETGGSKIYENRR